MHDHFLADIGKCILGAALLGLPAYLCRLPLILAYLAAGVLLGPHLGFGFVQDPQSISALSEIGLVLLMFILGLEIDVRKLIQAGKAVLVNGATQFLGCALLACLFFWPMKGLLATAGPYGLLYLAVACSLSSTLVVVKILSDRMELDVLTSRITLGILVIQDLWAIAFLAVQPDVAGLHASALVVSLSKATFLVLASFLTAKFVLPPLFRRVGKQPELMLIIALGWCFAACGLANSLHLSLEMGALVAGISIASFPYHLDVAAKVSSLRDFFITLFFVSLGLQIPIPTVQVLTLAGAVVAFVLLSRLLTVFPVLYLLHYGNRASLIPAVNLSQLSEFSLVLAALGAGYGHVKPELVSVFILAMVFTALISSLAIPSGHELYQRCNGWLQKLGFKDRLKDEGKDPFGQGEAPRLVVLGFFREASSLLQEMFSRTSEAERKQMLVVDFNPEVHARLKTLGIACKYGDIGHVDTLRHLGLDRAKVILCTVPDHFLKGTNNLQLLVNLRQLAPEARIVVTADTFQAARDLYEAGAAYVLVPRLVTSHYLADVLSRIQSGSGDAIRQGAAAFVQKRQEVLP